MTDAELWRIVNEGRDKEASTGQKGPKLLLTLKPR